MANEKTTRSVRDLNANDYWCNGKKAVAIASGICGRHINDSTIQDALRRHDIIGAVCVDHKNWYYIPSLRVYANKLKTKKAGEDTEIKNLKAAIATLQSRINKLTEGK